MEEAELEEDEEWEEEVENPSNALDSQNHLSSR
jgi:hypothetical protein